MVEGDSDEIRRLRAYCEELEDSIDDFEHNLRRCRDKLEGTASDSGDTHRLIALLERNREDNRRELAKARQRLARLAGAGDTPE